MICIIAGASALLIGVMFWYFSMHTLDGSADLYILQRKIMMTVIACGSILSAAGIIILMITRKMD